MELSIVVCIYNGESTLNATLESLTNQTLSSSDYEVILINDGSKDRSADICRDFINKNSQFNFAYIDKRNEGLSAARNSGISESKGRIIAFIDQDAAASETWAENIIKVFKLNKETILVSGPTDSFESDTEFSKFINKHHYSRKEGMKRVIGTNMSFEKSFFDDKGGFFDIFNHAGDETAVIEVRNIPVDQICYHQDVLVKHHFPNTLKKWLKEKKSNGKVSYLIESIKQDGVGPKLQLKHLIKYSYLVTPIVLFLPGWIKLLSVVPFCIFVIRANKNFIGLNETIKIHGYGFIPYYLKAIVITMMGLFYTDIGFINSWIRIKNLKADFLSSSYKGISNNS